MHNFKTNLVVVFLAVCGAMAWCAASAQAQDSQLHVNERTWSCTGEIQFPKEHPLGAPFTLTVISHMPDKSESRREYTVGADGRFSVSLAAGARYGRMLGQSDYCGIRTEPLGAGMLRRRQVKARPWIRNQFVVKAANGEVLQDVKAGWYGSLGWAERNSRHGVAVDDSGAFCVALPESEIWVYAKAKGMAMNAFHIKNNARFGVGPVSIYLQPLARVSGRLTNAKGHFPVSPDIFCEVPFRPHSDEKYTRLMIVEDGRFDLWVPANTKLKFSVSESGMRGSLLTAPLKPGQHLEDQVIELESGSILSGRIVDAKGNPIEGAFVRCLNGPNTPGSLGSGVRATPFGTVCTDTNGRFLFLDFDILVADIPRNDPHRAVNLSVAVLGLDGQIERQHFMAVPLDRDDNVLVFKSSARTASGRVVDVNGVGLQNFRVLLQPKDVPRDNYSEVISCGYGLPDLSFLQSPKRKGRVVDDAVGKLFSRTYPLTYSYDFSGTHGVFRIWNLPKGEWEARLEADGFVPVTIDDFEVSSKEPIVVEMEAAGELLFTLLKVNGEPAANQRVGVKRMIPDVDGTRSKYSPNYVFDEVYTDEHGIFRFQVDVAGTHEIYGRRWPRVTLELKVGVQTKKTVRIPGTGSIHGVFDWLGAPAQVRVNLCKSDRRNEIWTTRSHYGEFLISGVSPGSYELTFPPEKDVIKVEVAEGQVVELRILPDGESEEASEQEGD